MPIQCPFGSLSRPQGYAEAEPLFQRALGIWEQQLGPDHHMIATPPNGLAGLYLKQGKYAEAERFYQQALRISEQQLGPDHLEIASHLHGLAHLYLLQGKSIEAKLLYQRVLHIQELTFGANHSQTRKTRAFFMALLGALGQHEQAVQREVM